MSDVFDATSDPDVTPNTFVNVNDVDDAVDGVHVNVNTVPVDPLNALIVPLDDDVNETVGSVVVSMNVAVIGDAYPTYPVPVIVTPCEGNAVFNVTIVPSGAYWTFVNVNEVDVEVTGVQLNVNVFPVDPLNVSIVPLESPVNAIVGRTVDARLVTVIGDAYPTIPLPVIFMVCVDSDYFK